MGKKIIIITTILTILIILILFVVFVNIDNHNKNLNWDKIRTEDIAIVSKEWKTPILLNISQDGWEDGAYISSDGKKIYFAYYPGNIIADLQKMKFKDDIDVYYSEQPFIKKNKYIISEDIWSEGGVMISNKDIFYMSNKPIFEGDTNYDSNIYKNGELLELNTRDKEENDPHYCAKKGELYFWVDKVIYVYKNNEVIPLPPPINDGNENIQPFLTLDCQTLLFSSNRTGSALKIYKSKRLDENSWDIPELMISSKFGVGEPTLTDDGKFLFFVQIFRSEKGEYNSDIFYTEKKD